MVAQDRKGPIPKGHRVSNLHGGVPGTNHIPRGIRASVASWQHGGSATSRRKAELGAIAGFGGVGRFTTDLAGCGEIQHLR